MSSELVGAAYQYVTENIDLFHRKRLERLQKLKLRDILKRKNPYLFKAKNVLTAHGLVQSCLDAYLSSQEETIFGDFLEGLAIHLNQLVFGGVKSSAEGIDLEFERDGVRYIVSIKSGPNWGNSSQIKKMRDNFNKARRILRTSNSRLHVVAVNGCCYGKDSSSDKGDYFKYCGQQFWSFVSGDERLYTEIVEPLGHQAEQRNENFQGEYAKTINRFARDFAQEFCFEDGGVNWEKLLKFNSGK